MDEEAKTPENCPTCIAQRAGVPGRRHTVLEQRDHHPYIGHGCIDGKYTHPDLEPPAREAVDAARSQR